MTILLVGLNHHSAPIELREQLALSKPALQVALEQLRSYCQSAAGVHNGQISFRLQEAAILSTCNRFEILVVADNPDVAWQLVDKFLAGLQGESFKGISQQMYRLGDMDAVWHLMRVACGLDSMILGEPQILGQVAQAFSDAQAAGLTGPILSRLFAQAIHTGKRARSETDISRYTMSVSHAGALLLLDQVTVPRPNILVVGAGEMAVLAAKALQRHSICNLAFINRSYSHAESRAAELGAAVYGWHEFGDALAWADAIISATDAPHSVIYARDVGRAMPDRGGRRLVFVDLAVPRDVEVTVGEIEGVRRYDIDDLHSIVAANTTQRKSAVPQVEVIVEQEQNRFFEWYHSREVVSVIKDLRQWASEVAQVEVDQALNKLPDVDARTEQIVNRLAHRLVNKLLHQPTVKLRGQAAEGNGYAYAHTISELFDLTSTEEDGT